MHAYTRSTQFKNRCIMGGKGRGIMSDFRMGRVSCYWPQLLRIPRVSIAASKLETQHWKRYCETADR